RHAVDDDIGPVMVPIVAWGATDAAADALGQPIILARGKQMAIAFEHLLADRRHRDGRQPRVDVEGFERAVEPCDMLGEAKGLAVEAPRHVEDRVAAQKALVAEWNDDLALTDDLAVEPGDAFVTERHRRDWFQHRSLQDIREQIIFQIGLIFASSVAASIANPNPILFTSSRGLAGRLELIPPASRHTAAAYSRGTHHLGYWIGTDGSAQDFNTGKRLLKKNPMVAAIQ